MALWRWSDVARWASEAGLGASVAGERSASVAGERSASVIRAVNALLEARRAVAALSQEERSSLADLVA